MTTVRPVSANVESIRNADWSNYPPHPLDRRDRRNLSPEQQEERTETEGGFLESAVRSEPLEFKLVTERG